MAAMTAAITKIADSSNDKNLHMLMTKIADSSNDKVLMAMTSLDKPQAAMTNG
jgi:hypothetical protein